MDDSVPRSKRLLTDARSNVFVYVTGHGGNEFLKFQDNEEISAFDVADAFEQMWQKKRYANFFFICVAMLILLAQIQRTAFHGRHVSGEHHVLKNLLAEHLGNWFIRTWRKLLFSSSMLTSRFRCLLTATSLVRK